MAEDAYVLVAELTVSAERFDEFVQHSLEDGRRSEEDEAGCQQFDVSVKEDGSPTVVLYEVYDNVTAFELHMKTPHFARWRDATQDWITDRRVTRLRLKS
jgi:quinol monooxygenase YgiN